MRAIFYGLMNTLSSWRLIKGRRFEFERLYAEHGDLWNYASSEYEQTKYERTLELALKHRVNAGRALDVGCSVGVFSRLLARHFSATLAIDISGEAVRLASIGPAVPGLLFGRLNLLDLPSDNPFDVIVCSEVLYYLSEPERAPTLQKVSDLLAPGGVLITVSGISSGGEGSGYSTGWSSTMRTRLTLVEEREFNDPRRAYCISVFTKHE